MKPRWTTRLLHWFYDILVVLFVLLSAPYFVLRSWRDPALRDSIPGRFGRGPSRVGTRRCVWVHGVSVGEIKTAASVVKGLRERDPDIDVAVSSTTPAGMEVARRLYPDALVFQFPLDLSWIMRRVLRRIRPDLLVLMELEIWPNLLLQTATQGIPVVVVNGRITERSFRGYQRFSRLLPKFRWIRMFAVQSEEYAKRLRGLGVPAEQVRVMGNLKYDNLHLEVDPEEVRRQQSELGWPAEDLRLVAGSTHPGEEEILGAVYHRLSRDFPRLGLVVAPRHVDRAPEVAKLLARTGRPVATLTDVRRRRRVPEAGSILVVDTIGELELFYGMGTLAFVGGSMVPRGGHNILEPAGLGKPVLFGPHMDNFLEEVRLLRGQDAARVVEDASQLEQEIRRLLIDSEAAASLGHRARRAVASVRGTTRKTLDLIFARLDPDRQSEGD